MNHEDRDYLDALRHYPGWGVLCEAIKRKIDREYKQLRECPLDHVSKHRGRILAFEDVIGDLITTEISLFDQQNK